MNPMHLLSLLVSNIVFGATCGKRYVLEPTKPRALEYNNTNDFHFQAENFAVFQLNAPLFHSWELDDPCFKELVDANDEVSRVFLNGLVADYFPVFKYIRTSGLIKYKNALAVLLSTAKQTILDHKEIFDPGGMYLILFVIASLFPLLIFSLSCEKLICSTFHAKHPWGACQLCFSLNLSGNLPTLLQADNQKDLADMLIAFQQEEQQTSGNAILKQMEETHFIQVLHDLNFGEEKLLEILL